MEERTNVFSYASMASGRAIKTPSPTLITTRDERITEAGGLADIRRNSNDINQALNPLDNAESSLPQPAGKPPPTHQKSWADLFRKPVGSGGGGGGGSGSSLSSSIRSGPPSSPQSADQSSQSSGEKKSFSASSSIDKQDKKVAYSSHLKSKEEREASNYDVDSTLLQESKMKADEEKDAISPLPSNGKLAEDEKKSGEKRRRGIGAEGSETTSSADTSERSIRGDINDRNRQRAQNRGYSTRCSALLPTPQPLMAQQPQMHHLVGMPFYQPEGSFISQSSQQQSLTPNTSHTYNTPPPFIQQYPTQMQMTLPPSSGYIDGGPPIGAMMYCPSAPSQMQTVFYPQSYGGVVYYNQPPQYPIYTPPPPHGQYSPMQQHSYVEYQQYPPQTHQYEMYNGPPPAGYYQNHYPNTSTSSTGWFSPQQCMQQNQQPATIDNWQPPPPSSIQQQQQQQMGGIQEKKSNCMDGWNKAVDSLDRENRIREKVGLVINQRYKVLAKVNVGSYGSIYSALDMNDQQTLVAVKFETGMVEDSHLKYEKEVYNHKGSDGDETSNKAENIQGFPNVFYIGEEYGYKLMVMDLLGPSLENLFHYCSNHFRAETIYDIGIQMIDRVEHLHSRGFVHRDLKPDNFLMGIGKAEATCYLIDFGLARRIREGAKASTRTGKNLVGTAKYASLNSHNGHELSRRDDIESLAYILMEFINGELPWKEQKRLNRFRSKVQSYSRIRQMKEQMDCKTVCPPLTSWFNYVKQMKFEEKPDYNRLRKCLRSYLRNELLSSSSMIHGMSNMHLSSKPNEMSKLTPPPGEKGDSNVSTKESRGSATTGKSSTKDDELDSLRNPHHRLDWLERRDSSPPEKYTFECLYRWTLPHGENPQLPPNHKSSMSFGYGFGEGGFA